MGGFAPKVCGPSHLRFAAIARTGCAKGEPARACTLSEPKSQRIVRSLLSCRFLTVIEHPDAPSGTRWTRARSAEHAAHDDHLVHLWESEELLRDVVVDFLAEGLASQEPVLVFATRAHWEMFASTLSQRGFATDDAVARGMLTFLDAQEALERVTVDGVLSAARFEEVVGSLVEQRARGAETGRVQIFGEIVDLLWRAGKTKVAVELEELWNQLQSRIPFRLLCAYGVAPSSDLDELRELCSTHDRMWPSQPSGAGRLPTPQQMLAAEVQHRRRVEAALRESVRDLRAARQELEERARLNEMLVAILGHDLRNPLGAILTATQVVLDNNPGDERVRPLRWVLRSGERMARMIEQLLDFSSARVAGGIPLEPHDTSLHDIVTAVVEEARAGNERALHVEARGDLQGRFDPDRLAQVFSNLVGNALKHAEPESPIEVSLDGSGAQELVATVRSRGVIPSDVVPVIFEPFAGHPGARKGRRGLGLGLYITRAIVVGHGGNVAVSSSPAGGTTTFTVSLPRFSTAG